MKLAMKVLFGLLVLFVVAFSIGGARLAKAAPVTEIEEPSGYDWGYLATTAGATAAVLLIVQYTKGLLDKVGHVHTRLYVYILSLLILAGARAFTMSIGVKDIPLLIINAVVVATAAMGSYEITFGRGNNE